MVIHRVGPGARGQLLPRYDENECAAYDDGYEQGYQWAHRLLIRRAKEFDGQKLEGAAANYRSVATWLEAEWLANGDKWLGRGEEQ